MRQISCLWCTCIFDKVNAQGQLLSLYGRQIVLNYRISTIHTLRVVLLKGVLSHYFCHDLYTNIKHRMSVFRERLCTRLYLSLLQLINHQYVEIKMSTILYCIFRIYGFH